LRFFNYRIYFVNHPDVIEDVLVHQARKFAKGRVLKKNKRLFGRDFSPAKGISGYGSAGWPSRLFIGPGSLLTRLPW